MKNISKTNGSKQKWIEKGYEYFALYGPNSLNINKISKDIGLARTTFYHHFGDLEIFTDELLNKHWEICLQFGIVGSNECKKLIPDIYNLLEQYPIPLRFSKQLFINRHVLSFNYLFIKIYNHHANMFVLKLFSEHFKLYQSKEYLNSLWATVGESWFSRLDVNDLSTKSMQLLAEDIMKSVLKITSSNSYYNK